MESGGGKKIDKIELYLPVKKKEKKYEKIDQGGL